MHRRLACLDLPAFPLQLMLGAHPEWRDHPAVRVDEDRPQGLVLEVNAHARAAGVLPGQRYATALGLCRTLRAGVVLPAVTGQGVARTLSLLRAFSPDIEASADEPGVFWLDATGLLALFDSLEAWGRRLLAHLDTEGLSGALAIGLTRFGTYALARRLSATAAAPPLLVVDTPAAERELVAAVPLAHLNLRPLVRERLDRLGVRTVGALAALPAPGLVKRYGREMLALHRLVSGAISPPLQPDAEVAPLARQLDFDTPERDAHRLLFHLKSILDALIPLAAARDAWIAELLLSLGVERSPTSHAPAFTAHRLRPAAPSLDAALFLELLRLRLEHLDLGAGLIAVRLELLPLPASHDQLRLFATSPRRDGARAAEALARIRAELGEEAVSLLTLREGHLPRAAFARSPLGDGPLQPPDPSPPDPSPPDPGEADDRGDGAGLVRVLLPRPLPLPPGALPPPPPTADGDLLAPPPVRPPFRRLFAPWHIGGGWWQREVRRVYFWAETDAGELLWLYWDLHRRAWFQEGHLA